MAIWRARSLQRTSKVYAWFPDGRVEDVSPEAGTYYQSCIHPNGTDVIFAGAETGPPRIFRTDFSSLVPKPLTPADSAAFLATYSWDGTRIVFSSDRDFPGRSIGVEEIPDPRLYRPGTRGGDRHRYFSLYIMDADGSNVRRITTGEHRDLRGSFSPDGRTIVFFSDRSYETPLWTVPADGSAEPTPIPVEGNERWTAFRPWYSLDGETIYFFGSRKGIADRKRILFLPVTGGRPHTLPWDDRGKTQGPFIDGTGRNLLFHSTRTGRAELYEYPLDGDEGRMLVPPLDPSLPEDREVMHPTRSKNGVVTFDISLKTYSPLDARLYGWHIKARKLFWRVRKFAWKHFGIGER